MTRIMKECPLSCVMFASHRNVFFPVVLYGFVFGLAHRMTVSADRALRKLLGQRGSKRRREKST